MLKDERTQNWNGQHTRFVITVSRLFSAETWDAINRAVVAAIISLCTLGVTSQQAAAQAYVQGNFAVPQTPQTTVTVSYNAAQTAGNLNLVIVGWNDAAALISSVSDSMGNTYTLAVGPTILGGTLSQSIYYAKNIVAATAGGNAVKVQFAAAAIYPDIRILEYSGLDPTTPLDKAVGASGSSATSNSGSVTTANATDLLVGANIVATSTNGPGASFTQRLLTAPDGDIAEDRVVTATGSYSAGAPLAGAGGWVMQMVALKASGGGTGATIPSVTASGATNVTATTATLNGSIVSTGNQMITSDGFDYGTTTSYGTHVTATTVQSGSFSANITGLTSGTTYHYRATAVNASGTGVSSDSQFVVGGGGGGNTGAQVTGQWRTLTYQMPINPIRVGLLHTGQIVIISGSENNPTEHDAGTSVGGLWDPKTSLITVIPMLWDVFCNGGSFFADGRCMTFGGTTAYDNGHAFYGDPRTTVFDPLTDLFNNLQDMSDGRWYATAITLGDGRVMVFSGYDSNGNVNQNVEFYTVGSGFSATYLANWTPSLYPWLHLLPNGKVFCSGYFSPSQMFDPSSPGSNWQPSAPTVYGFQRLYGNSVLLPLLPTNNYVPRVMILGGATTAPNATDTTEIIDLSKTSPAWVGSGKMPSGARIEGNSVLLPNGKLLVQGGSAVDEQASTATLGADLFDPSTGLWSSAGKATYPRLYHSVALLLPDATVATAGSNPVRGTYDPHIEIYSPAYLFTTDANGNTILATRPTITSTPTNIGYAGSFQVQTPNAANISSVVLIRDGSDTHAFDMDQRLVGLTFTAGSGVLNVTGPPNQNIAPPGYYMLFLVNSAGVPSIANFVQVSNSPTDQPPKGTITSPAGNLTVGLNQTVNFAGTATDADGTVARQQWVFPEGNPLTSPSLNAGSVLFPEAGTYVVSLTAVDNLGVNDPSPPTRTITVSTATGTVPSVTASGATSVTATTATLNGSILSNGGQTITIDGFDYGTTTAYGTHVSANLVQTGAFSMNITGLTSGTTYHYRATATNASGTGVSPDSQFGSGGTIPSVSTGSGATNVTATTATLNGSILSNGGQTITIDGFDYGTTTAYGAHVSANLVQTGAFSMNITGLTSGTTYHYRATATNASGTGMSSDSQFGGGGGTPTYVQGNSATPQTAQTTVTVPYNAAQTAGNLNLVIVGWSDATVQITSVTDSKGNPYALAVATVLTGNGGPLSQSIYYAKNIASATAGANGVKVTFNAAAVFPDVRVLEYGGLNLNSPLDVAVGASGNSATSSSGSVTTTSATDLLVGANTVWTSTTGAGPGFTMRLSTPDGDIAEDRVVTTTGSYSASAPLSAAGGWVVQMVALHP